jgi:hypothetical protein
MSDEHKIEPVLGERGEHPLSVLLFSWMRGKMFVRVLAIVLVLVGVGSIGLEVWLAYKPIKDITSMPGFYALFGFLAFGGAVLSGWPLGKLLRRREDYYDTRSGEAGRDR